MKLLTKPWVLPTLTGGIGLGLGFSAGFLFARRRRNVVEVSVSEQVKQLNFEFDEDMKAIKEVAEKAITSKHPTNYRGFNVVNNEPQEAVDGDDFAEYDFDDDGNAFVVRKEEENVDYNKLPGVLKLEVEVSPGVTNIFTVDRHWDYTEECKKRTPFTPYVIHQDEFMSNESELDQTSLNYYEADDIMTDDKDVIVFEYIKTVGELKFGHGSSDSNVFYVRNEKLMLEFEVLRNPGSYQEEVLGEQIEKNLKHSKTQKKFKKE